MIRCYGLMVFQTKHVHVVKGQVLFNMWLHKEIYKEKHTVQVPLSFLLYFHELYLLSECHFFFEF